MDYLYLILGFVIVVMGFLVWFLVREKKETEKDLEMARKEAEDYAELGKGLAEYNQRMQEKKNLAKEKIAGMLKGNKIGNREVAKALRISSTTAVRYLDELEKEGRAKQVGRTGKSVFYVQK